MWSKTHQSFVIKKQKGGEKMFGLIGGIWGNIIGLVALVCAIWVIYEVFTVNRKLSTGAKILWTVLAIIFSIITAIVYYFMYKYK